MKNKPVLARYPKELVECIRYMFDLLFVKYVAKMTNFGPLKKPLKPPYGSQKNQKQAKFMLIHDGYLS